MALIKKVNVYPTRPVTGLIVPLTSPAIRVNMTTDEIYKCLTCDALVQELLPDGSIVKLNLTNYNKDNTGAGTTNDTISSIVNAISSSLSDSEITNIAVSGEAIKKYVKYKISEVITNKFIESITYDVVNKVLKYVTGDPEDSVHKVPITGFVSNVKYLTDTNALSFDLGNRTLDVPIPNIYLQSGAYNDTTKKITLKLSDGNIIEIPLTNVLQYNDLVSGNGINVTKNQLGKMIFDVKISSGAGNLVQLKQDGLYVEDKTTNKLDKLPVGNAGQVIVANNDGTLASSGVKIGGEQISDIANANTLLTEKAAKDEIVKLEQGISDITINNEIVTSQTISYANPSEDKLVSEEAYVKSLSMGSF